MTSALRIDSVGAETIAQHIDALAEILHACVHDGASVGFVLPFEVGDARKFFSDSVVPALARGKRILLVARLGDEIAGTGQLNVDTMPNQVHRADVMKVLVHPRYQRKGIGRALMNELERIAVGLGRTLLTLDTVAGDKAEPLYLSLGYQIAGRIPRYARAAKRDELETTSVMFKMLDERR
jgi:ribosomal protein S18 acetylase RimI-like enzyme